MALAAAHKGVAVEWVDVPWDDRTLLVEVSGQPLAPVLVAGKGAAAEVVSDSPVILRWLEERYPQPPLLPADPAARAEIEVFCDWFNRVWKKPPNAIDRELGRADRGETPDAAAIAGWSAELAWALGLFEGLLTGRDFLFGGLSLADVTAFPFLRYPVLGCPPGDDERFHRILVEHMPLGGGYPGLRGWVARMDALPRA